MNPGLYQRFFVTENQILNVATRSLQFDQTLPAAVPGQFVMAWLPGVGEKPFSIAADRPFSLTVAAVGPFSQALASLQPGNALFVRGPLGQGFSPHGSNLLLAGGGYGAAPLKFLAQSALARGARVTACLGARSSANLLLDDELSALGCRVWTATEDGSSGRKGLVTDLVRAALEEGGVDGLFACGPEGMLRALAGLAQAFNVEAQLSFEGLMRCGIGLCGSCELAEEVCQVVGLPDGWLVCRDGPVAVLPARA